jgi:hypothetical protein
MKALVMAACLLTSALPAGAMVAQQALNGTWRANLENTWTRNNGEQWVSFQLYRDDEQRFGMSVPIAELEGLGARGDRLTAADVKFGVRRDAGNVEFEGRFTEGRGAGSWRFTPNGAFVSALRPTYPDLSSEQILRLAIHDVTRGFVQEVKSAGVDKLSVDDLVKMRIHGVTPEFIREMRELGYKDLNVEDLVQLRIHGASPSFIREMRDLGYKDLPLRDIVRMRIHGVSAQFVKELRDLGYANVSVDDLVKMRIHNVTPAFIRDVRAAGLKDMTPDDLVEFSIHGGRRWLRK